MQGAKSMGSSQEAGMGHPAAQVSEGQNAEKDPVVHDETQPENTGCTGAVSVVLYPRRAEPTLSV